MFEGPGFYSIVSYQSPDLCCNSWGGTMNSGEEVKLYAKSPMYDNQTWAFVPVPHEQEQFYLINVHNGYYLTGNKNKSVTLNKQIGLRDKSARWTLQYEKSQGRYDTYFINCVDPECGQLNVAGGGNKSGTQILSWPTSNTENTKFYLDLQRSA